MSLTSTAVNQQQQHHNHDETTNDNDDNKSISSTISSNKNAEIIAAAFSATFTSNNNTNISSSCSLASPSKSNNLKDLDDRIIIDNEDSSELILIINNGENSISNNNQDEEMNDTFNDTNHEQHDDSDLERSSNIEQESEIEEKSDNLINKYQDKVKKTKINKKSKNLVEKQVRKGKQLETKRAPKQNNSKKEVEIKDSKLSKIKNSKIANKSVVKMDKILKKRKIIQKTSYDLKRQCTICKMKVHQENLSDHLYQHYAKSNKCFQCDKISTNQTNYITHYLSHLEEKQFICIKCDKWFRQPVLYKRHLNTECKETESNDLEDMDEDDENVKLSQIAKSLKRKNLKSSHQNETNYNKRKNLDLKELAPIPRPKGRPRKYFPNTINSKKDVKENTKNNKRELRDRKTLTSNKNLLDDGFETVEEETSKSNNDNKNKTKTRAIKKKFEKNQSKIKNSITNHKNNNNNDQPVKMHKQTRSSTRKQAIESSKLIKKDQLNPENNNYNTEEEEEEEDKLSSSSQTSPTNTSNNEDDLKDVIVSDYEMERQVENSNKKIDDKNQSSSAQIPPPLPNISINSTKDLSTFGTYKIKITRRRPSNNQNIKQNNENTDLTESIKELTNFQRTISSNSLLTATPQKLNNLELILSTPSKNEASVSSNLLTKSESINSNNNNTNEPSIQPQSFECPECEKKFVSYYGLVQHYDQHPNLAVTCVLCEITFENHQSLVQHNTNVHHLIEKSNCLFNKDKENLLANNQLLSRKPINKDPNSKEQNATSKKAKNLQAKSKSQQDDLINNDMSNNQSVNNTNHDLSALPSIMTRTSRLGILNNRLDVNNQNSNLAIQSAASIKASLTSSAAILNHTLTVKTSGFADLSFIDFSCINFPRIAQNYCELWPRKLQTNKNLVNNYNPLHNYTCDLCGFYFPCLASLELHKIIKDKSSMRNNCKLFMTNSKYLDYEKTLDEILNKIDLKSNKNRNEPNQEEFLQWFGLVHSDKIENKYTQMSNINTKIIKNLKLEQYVNKSNTNIITNTKTINQQLYLKLRKQMLGINRQFIVDLDKWKSMHLTSNSNDSDDFSSFNVSSKVHLKPHVNLNRPILIRSKKLKRNNNNNTNNLNLTNNSINSNNNNDTLNKLSIIQPVKIPILSNNTNTSNKSQNNVPSKPYFTPNIGTFNNSPKNKKRKLQQQNNDKDSEDSDKETINPARAMAALSVVDKNISNNTKKIKSNENDLKNTNETIITNIKIKKKELKRLQNDDRKLKKIQTVPSNVNKNKIILPKPPQLYKAPNHPNNHPNLIQNTSANSSILSRASGMNNNLIAARNMLMPPKLQPMVNNNNNSVKPSNLTPIMPKLTKPSNTDAIVNRQMMIPHPPQLLIPSQSLISSQHNKKQLLLNGPPKLISPIGPNLASTSTSEQLVRINKNSENHSLKCKFCLQIFKGQSEFFQHVISKHPKTLKQRLNKANRVQYTNVNKHSKLKSTTASTRPIAPKKLANLIPLNQDSIIQSTPNSLSSINHHHHNFQSGSSSNNSNSISSTHSD